MKKLLIAFGAGLLINSAAEAQRPQRQQQMQQELRQQVTQRFLAMYAQTAGLDEGQREQFSEQVQASFEWGAVHSAQERDIWQALEAQMRPGVAADIDSLDVLGNSLDRHAATQSNDQHGPSLRPQQRSLVPLEKFTDHFTGIFSRLTGLFRTGPQAGNASESILS